MIPNIKHPSPPLRAQAERKAVNFCVQGTFNDFISHETKQNQTSVVFCFYGRKITYYYYQISRLKVRVKFVLYLLNLWENIHVYLVDDTTFIWELANEIMVSQTYYIVVFVCNSKQPYLPNIFFKFRNCTSDVCS